MRYTSIKFPHAKTTKLASPDMIAIPNIAMYFIEDTTLYTIFYIQIDGCLETSKIRFIFFVQKLHLLFSYLTKELQKYSSGENHRILYNNLL